MTVVRQSLAGRACYNASLANLITCVSLTSGHACKFTPAAPHLLLCNYCLSSTLFWLDHVNPSSHIVSHYIFGKTRYLFTRKDMIVFPQVVLEYKANCLIVRLWCIYFFNQLQFQLLVLEPEGFSSYCAKAKWLIQNSYTVTCVLGCRKIKYWESLQQVQDQLFN